MAWTFADEIHALTGYNADGTGESISEETLIEHADQWLTDAAKTVIQLLPIHLKMKCSTAVELSNSPTTIDMDSLGEILLVTREDANAGTFIPCREIPPTHASLATDTDSIMYEATATDPVYYVLPNSSGNPTLFVKPVTDSNQTGYVYHVAYPPNSGSFGDGDAPSTSKNITNFPNEAEPLVVLEASMKALCYKMAEMHTLVPKHSDQDGTYADPGGFTAGASGSQGWEAIRHWIETEEDSELAGVNAQVLGAEVQQWIAEYQWYQSKHQMLKAEFGEKLMAFRGGGLPQPQQEKPQPNQKQGGRR